VKIVDDRSNYAGSCQYKAVSRGPSNVARIILHNTLGSWNSFKYDWQNCKEPRRIGAAHFVVRRDGTVLRTIPERYIAFHAKGANSDSIGIEIESAPIPENNKTNYEPQGMTPIQERTVIALTKMMQAKWGVSKSGITMHRIAQGAASTSCASMIWGRQNAGGDGNFVAWRNRTF
jgi:N-acetyl-anhydromuramyl-L-alanine amidase AmpD